MKRMTQHNRKRAKHLIKNHEVRHIDHVPALLRWAMLKWGEWAEFDASYNKNAAFRWGSGIPPVFRIVPTRALRLYVKVWRWEFERFALSFNPTTANREEV